MKYPIKPLSFLLICCLGLGLRTWQAQRVFQEQQEVFPNFQKGTFRAWVTEEPEVLFEHPPGSHDTGRLNGVYQPLVKEVRAVCVFLAKENSNYRPLPSIKVRCTFRLSPEIPQPVLSYGETIEIQGKIQKPAQAMNPGQFDYAHYLKTKRVAYVMYAAPGHLKRLEAEPEGWTFLRLAYGLKRKAEDAIYRFLPYPENALLDGILLGERTSLPEDLVQSFFLTGTIHILAVSGMITAFVAGLFFLVFRTLQINRKWAAALSLLGLGFFVFMTGAHPPVCRAGLFSALALLAVLCERRIHGGTLLMTTAVVLVAFNPFILEDLSFQISFLATAGLMVMAPWFMEKLAFLPKPVALLVTATTAAQLSVWCLIIYDFNQLSLYSIFANLAIVPLALFATAAGLATVAGSFVHPFLGSVFGAGCGVSLKLLIFLSDQMVHLPKAEWIMASPPLAWVALFHALLLFSFLCFWPRRQPEKSSENWKIRDNFFLKGRRIAAIAWGFFVLGTVSVWAVSTFCSQPLRVTFLSVGHGNAVVLRSPEGKIFVVDGGKETRGPDRYLPLVAFLRHTGVQKVDGLLNTHPDEDHVGGLVNLMSAYPTALALEGTQAKSGSEIYKMFKRIIQDRQIPFSTLKEGDRISGFGEVHFLVLHPPDSYHPSLHPDNNRSLVTLVSFGAFSMILPGDLEKAGIQKLLKDHQPFPRVDWLMAPHHGRASGEPLLCAQGFHPRFVVFSDWRDYPDSRKTYESLLDGSTVLATAETGAIELEVNASGEGRYRCFREGLWHSFKIQSNPPQNIDKHFTNPL